MIASVISLIRANRANGIQTSTRAQLALLSTAAADSLPDVTTATATATARHRVPLASPMASEQAVLTGSPEAIDGPSGAALAKAWADEAEGPLSAADMGALFDLSPGLLVQAHVAAVDRMFATAACSEEESSEEDEDEDEDENGSADEGGADGMEVDGAGARPKQAGKTPCARLAPAGKAPRVLSRANSRVGSGSKARSRSGTASGVGGGREQFVIDPTAVGLPRGHPDVALGAFAGAAAGAGAGAGAGGLPSAGEGGEQVANALGLTPGGGGSDSLAPPVAGVGVGVGRKPSLTLSLGGAKPGADAAADLRNQLFPEDAAPTAAAAGAGAGAGADAGAGGGGGGEAAGGEHESSTDGESEVEEGEGRDGDTKPKTKGKPGRRLYDVVDSVSLLSGVLE